jgi:hypothetical protein
VEGNLPLTPPSSLRPINYSISALISNQVAICQEKECGPLCNNAEDELKAREGKVAELEGRLDAVHKGTMGWDAKGRDGEESDGH